MRSGSHFVDHMPSCLHVLLRVARPLPPPPPYALGMFPWWCGATIVHSWVFLKEVCGV